jgi:hypothetical protein
VTGRRLLLAACVLCGALPCAWAQQAQQSSVVDRWREVLRYGIESEVLDLIQKIKASREEALNPELLDLLGATSSQAIESGILEVFSQAGFRGAEPLARRALADEENRQAGALVPYLRYLAAIRASGFEELVIPLLDEGAELAAAAIQTLGAIGSPAAGEALLARLKNAEYPENLKGQLILALGSLKYSPAVEELVSIASDTSQESLRRAYAASALGEIGDPRGIPALRELFAEPNSLVKMHAAGALAGFDLAEVEPLLQDGLRDSDAKVRLAAAKALARKDAQKSVEILIYKARYDPDRQVRVQAIRSLGVIGGARAVAYLSEAYRDPLPADLYRDEALGALLAAEPGAALAAARSVVDEESARKGGSSALEFTARRLAGLSRAGMEDLFRRFLKNPAVTIRLYGLRGIELNHARSLLEEVRFLADNDPHPAVRREAQRALEAL